MRYYLTEVEEVIKEKGGSANGLSEEQAVERREKYGANKLAESRKTPLFVRFLKQLADPMILILLAAALISGITAVMQNESFADVIIILAVVILNAVLGVIQESKAEKAIESLKEMTAAIGILQIGVHHGPVPADPVGGGAVGLELLVVGAQGQVVDQTAVAGRTEKFAGQLADQAAQGQQEGRFLSGAGENGRGDRTWPANQIGAGEEGAHGVPQHHIGQVRILVAQQKPQLTDVLRYQIPAVLRAEVAVQMVVHGLAVAQMVLAGHQKALPGQPGGEGGVTVDVFRHAVDDLHHGPGRTLRPPHMGIAAVDAVAGRKIKFLLRYHKKFTPFSWSMV